MPSCHPRNRFRGVWEVDVRQISSVMLLKFCVVRIGLARIVEVAPARRISARHQLTVNEVDIRDVRTMNGHSGLKSNAGPSGRVLGGANFGDEISVRGSNF